MARTFKQVDSHNSLLTNREMAILSSQIDGVATQAMNSLRFDDICRYFNHANYYYLKLPALIVKERRQKSIELIAIEYQKLRELIANDARYQHRRALQKLLDLANAYHREIRASMQDIQYYVRTSGIRDKGLDSVPMDSTEEEDD